MEKYQKPVAITIDDTAEGVYAASGSGCYNVNAEIVQTPMLGNETYCIQLNAVHNASHHSGKQVIKISFNQVVTYEHSGAVNVTGSGTNTLFLTYNYHSNNIENIGLGHLYIKGNAGLAITSAECVECNEDCGVH